MPPVVAPTPHVCAGLFSGNTIKNLIHNIYNITIAIIIILIILRVYKLGVYKAGCLGAVGLMLEESLCTSNYLREDHEI